jgi:hypothetical protein
MVSLSIITTSFVIANRSPPKHVDCCISLQLLHLRALPPSPFPRTRSRTSTSFVFIVGPLSFYYTQKMCMYDMFLTSETLRFGWSHLQTFEKSLFALAITSLVYGKILKRKLSVKRTATFGCQCSLVTNLKSPQVAIKGRNMYL